MTYFYVEKPFALTGADCTGSDGATNRTYDTGIQSSRVLSGSVQVTKSVSMLTEGVDFSLSGTTMIVTFLTEVYNSESISIRMEVRVSSDLPGGGLLKYATVNQFVKIIGLKSDVPSWAVGSTPTKETVASGSFATVVYLDHKSILSNSYNLYYGASSAAAIALTENTHYTIDLTTGAITPTAAGTTLVGSSNVYASYSYINNGMTDEYLESVLLRAQQRVDDETNTTFTNGLADNPEYPSKTDVRSSRGPFDQQYQTKERPLIDLTSALADDINASQTTIEIEGTDGDLFPLMGFFVIGTEAITYTGITGDTFTGCTRGALGSTAATHEAGDAIHSTILRFSTTNEGSTPTFEVLEWETDFYADEYGKFTITNAKVNCLPYYDVANRIKINYFYGYDTIPATITRLTLLFAKQMLMMDNVGKSVIAGRNEFRPELINADNLEIERIISDYIKLPMENT